MFFVNILSVCIYSFMFCYKYIYMFVILFNIMKLNILIGLLFYNLDVFIYVWIII